MTKHVFQCRFFLFVVLLPAACSAVQRSGQHRPLPFPGQPRRIRVGRNSGHRPLQQQDVAARIRRLPQLRPQVADWQAAASENSDCSPSSYIKAFCSWCAARWRCQTWFSLWSSSAAVRPKLPHRRRRRRIVRWATRSTRITMVSLLLLL